MVSGNFLEKWTPLLILAVEIKKKIFGKFLYLLDMKYLITESKLNDAIKTYILSQYNMVHDVYFTTKKVVMGSSENHPIINKNVINVIINNSENKLKYLDLRGISNDIVDSVDGFFNLNSYSYGSKWEFNFGQLAVVIIESELFK